MKRNSCNPIQQEFTFCKSQIFIVSKYIVLAKQLSPHHSFNYKSVLQLELYVISLGLATCVKLSDLVLIV